ncbi:hypothetical protein [Roseobacter ponti]|uniref:Uncharacterized protein n=1 Tax=Roseobacter ponti TaxID=1891787 RepID=A0A858STU2_9RHOB|nr:hypothetical protein [Roseobacter ponti]QJF50296.1 hypothetical protein G3256_03505 [Roseobacter ponti]
MDHATQAPERVLEALKRFGVSENVLASVTSQSQIVSDLGIWGDDWNEFYELLSEVYGTDNLIPHECVPSEFAWQKTLKGWLPWVAQKDAVQTKSLSTFELDCVMRGHPDPWATDANP